ncbi:MAG: X2-like carbohydrate binding domain-containing protein [Acutalibacteraceae bacterium]
MKKNIKNHHAGRIVSLLLMLCMVLSIAPVMAFASGNADQNITLVDFGNVWKNLDSTQPVAFTTELNPNSACSNQMDITAQSWVNFSYGDIMESNASEKKPTALASYDFCITFTAKEGYTFPYDSKSGAFTGTVICDGTTIVENGQSKVDGVSAFMLGNTVFGTTLRVLGYPKVVATDGASQDNYVINNVVINNAPTSCTAGEAPAAQATAGGESAPNYTFYEYWEEWEQTANGLEPVKFWYSDAQQMSRVPEGKAITAFEEGKTYSYSIIATGNENYTFASRDTLSVMLNGSDFSAKSEPIMDGKSLMIGPGAFMKPVNPAEQKEIELIEINNATVSFHVGDRPVFTGTTPDDALYVVDYEGWRGEDDAFICSSDYWNNAYVEHGWCGGPVSSFKADTDYMYMLYVKLTDEAAAQGYVFGPNTKLKVNGKDVDYPHMATGIVLQVGTDLTMTPTAAGASDYKIIEGANGTWTQNSDGTLIFRANGNLSKFTGVKIDDTLIDAKNYTAVSGSTIITLKADYLKTLSVGTHKLTVVYNDGECSTNFEVKAATEQTEPTEGDKTDTTTPTGGKDTTSPQTGDNSNLLLWVALLFVSGAGVIGTTVYSKRKKRAE